MRIPILFLFALTLAIPLSACSSGGGTNKVPEPPPHRDPFAGLEEEPKEVEIPAPRLGTGAEFTAAERSFMNRSFRAFMREEADWPVRRKKWQAMGGPATNVLVENLLVYQLAAQNAARPQDARRAQAELIDIGAPAVPYLMQTLRMETFRDRTGNRQKVDDLTRKTVAETLALLGEPAIDPLVRALPNLSAGSRRAVARCMRDLVDPRVTRALTGLLDDESFVVAADAAAALGTHPGEAVTRRLLAVYADGERDVIVRKKAGEALLIRKDRAIVADLVQLLERASREDDLGLLRSTGAILRRTTGKRLPNDPAAWRAALTKDGGR
jgi:hypothetical protein